MPTPCYLVEETTEQRVSLRRFGFGLDEQHPERYACPAKQPWASGYRPGCDASSAAFATVPLVVRAEGELAGVRERVPDWPRDDPHWPTVCASCGQPFTHDEMWQTNGDPIMRVVAVVPGAALAVGEVAATDDLPPGAMWFPEWLREWSLGFDGRGLMVKLPDGHLWQVDSEANNCTRKGDRSHRCWLRQGEPPFVTVNKEPRHLTCDAGAGSILSPGYHGFLVDGVLT